MGWQCVDWLAVQLIEEVAVVLLEPGEEAAEGGLACNRPGSRPDPSTTPKGLCRRRNTPCSSKHSLIPPPGVRCSSTSNGTGMTTRHQCLSAWGVLTQSLIWVDLRHLRTTLRTTTSTAAALWPSPINNHPPTPRRGSPQDAPPAPPQLSPINHQPPNPLRQRRCAIQPGVARPPALPRVQARSVHYPEGVVPSPQYPVQCQTLPDPAPRRTVFSPLHANSLKKCNPVLKSPVPFGVGCSHPQRTTCP